MKKLLLTKIRLSYYFWILFFLFLVTFYFLPTYEFSGAALTLFSVNSFLYGFYISPILSGQKGRIDDLHKTIRAEANAIFTLQIKLKKLPKELRTDIQKMIDQYLQKKISGQKSDSGEAEYEKLISFCIEYKGKYESEVDDVLGALVANQQNRTQFTMLMSGKVYSNEWMIMMILFSITTSIIMLIDVQQIFILTIVKALLCTGLTMLMIILVKLNTLSHKKAKLIWDPFKTLLESHYYRID